MKVFKTLFFIGSAAFFLWIVVSFFDINAHNHPFEDDYKDYAEWNFFNVMFDGGDSD